MTSTTGFSKFTRSGMLAALLAVGAAPGTANSADMSQQPPALRKAPAPDQPDISGVWIVTNFTPKGVTIDGKGPPLQPWARDIYDKRLALADREGLDFNDTEAYCLSGGMPRMMTGSAYPVQILQTTGQVTILFELMRNVRFIHLTDKHPDTADIDPSYNGDSIARWEGDALIVDTIGLLDRTTVDNNTASHIRTLCTSLSVYAALTRILSKIS